MDAVKAVVGGVRASSTGVGFTPGVRFARGVRSSPTLSQEHAMADVAFVVTTVAVFALVVFIARGVAKL
ncbi:hypothetical protein [Streptomyces marianii]|uniref:Uncharacterized protein n=1 Tax=Streptomyces marianii TaxID=1817406 RepID=A0A5R9E5Y3_9ACTN|nr:hypothetical protein [Streptomyces marianii]TLQ44707.1 hypothetical protein FEF34_17850 [Streptomyces marianii]